MSLSWLKFLPAALRARIEHRPNLQKILTNTGWLFADKILRMVLSLFVAVWVARYLGPGQFGILSYAMAIIALFSAIASLGLNGIVVRDLVKDPDCANVTMGTAFFLRIIGGLIAYILALFAISFTRPEDGLAKLMVAVLGMVMLFNATDVVKYWFESRVQAKYTVWVGSSTFLVLSAVKVGLILAKAPLMAFVWAMFAEGVIVAVGLLAIYAWRGGALIAWRIQIIRARTLLKDSWPLVLSGLAIMVYMRIDQIMLGQMLGDEAVGLYTAAVQISEAWYFIPMAIVASVFPSIIEAKQHSETLYYQRLQKLYNLMVLLAVAVAMPMTFLSEWLVALLYGDAYAPAGVVLAIHIWTGVFVFLGVASSSWYLAENMQLLAFYRTLLGAIINIIANLALIPRYGISGAAIGTVLSQISAAYIFDLMYASTRQTFCMKTRAILPFFKCKLSSY